MNKLYPDLLVQKNLEAPFKSALSQLEDILQSADKQETDSAELRGLAVLAVAAVETAFLDAMAYYQVARPESVELNKASFSRTELFEARAPLDLILVYAARRVRRLAYNSFSTILDRFAETMKLGDLPDLSLAAVVEFEKFKEARNKIVHGHSDLTTALLERPVQGGLAKPRLKPTDVVDGVKCSETLLKIAIDQIGLTYGKYSRLAAIERLWYWMFNSPVMKFERFWKVDVNKDTIVAATGAQDSLDLSNGERILLSVWLAHFNHTLDTRPLTMYSLDLENQRKALHLLAMTGRFRMY